MFSHATAAKENIFFLSNNFSSILNFSSLSLEFFEEIFHSVHHFSMHYRFTRFLLSLEYRVSRIEELIQTEKEQFYCHSVLKHWWRPAVW